MNTIMDSLSDSQTQLFEDEPTGSEPVTNESFDDSYALDEPIDSESFKDEPSESNHETDEPINTKPIEVKPLMEIEVKMPPINLGPLMDLPINPIWINQQPSYPGWMDEEGSYEPDYPFQDPYRAHNNPYMDHSFNRRPYPSWSDEETDQWVDEPIPYESPRAFKNESLNQPFLGQPMGRRRPTDKPSMRRPLLEEPIGHRPIGPRPYPNQPISRRPPKTQQLGDHRRSSDQQIDQKPPGKPVGLMDLPIDPPWDNRSSAGPTRRY